MSQDEALAFTRCGGSLFARIDIAAGVPLLEKAFLNLFVDFERGQTGRVSVLLYALLSTRSSDSGVLHHRRSPVQLPACRGTE
jgi:hypothetical protein